MDMPPFGLFIHTLFINNFKSLTIKATTNNLNEAAVINSQQEIWENRQWHRIF